MDALAQDPDLGLQQCVGVCELPDSDGKDQLCGACYDTDPYYNQTNWPHTYQEGSVGATNGFGCDYVLPSDATEETFSQAWAVEDNANASTKVAQNYECGACTLKSVSDSWLQAQFVQPYDDYRTTDPNCLRDGDDNAPIGCKRLFTVLQKCESDLQALLITGMTFAPTAMPTTAAEADADKGSESPLPIILGATALVVAAALFFGARLYFRKKRAAGASDESTAEVEMKNPGAADPGRDL
jgi:hypothetical protein